MDEARCRRCLLREAYPADYEKYVASVLARMKPGVRADDETYARRLDICRACGANGLEVKRIRMVHPFAGKEANMVLIDAVKGGRSYVHVEAPLIVYREKGVYTQEVREIYG